MKVWRRVILGGIENSTNVCPLFVDLNLENEYQGEDIIGVIHRFGDSRGISGTLLNYPTTICALQV